MHTNYVLEIIYFNFTRIRYRHILNVYSLCTSVPFFPSVFREVRNGYFIHHSKLLYIKGIGVGQTPIFCHLIFESVDEHHYESLRLKETNLPYISLFSKVSLSRFPNVCPMMINFSSKKPVLSHTLGFLCTHFWFCADRWRRQRRASDFARSRFQNSA